ncbi:MAG: inorganic phosphate transporter, partial [Corynebacterium sp.]|nr:inorganic phosphate transporter [Corynebacterium sp.]
DPVDPSNVNEDWDEESNGVVPTQKQEPSANAPANTTETTLPATNTEETK